MVLSDYNEIACSFIIKLTTHENASAESKRRFIENSVALILLAIKEAVGRIFPLSRK